MIPRFLWLFFGQTPDLTALLMKPLSVGAAVILALSFTALVSCSGKNEDFVTEPVSDYVPLQTGKYITYRVDSVITSNFGSVLDTVSYQVKHTIDSAITDNLGRPSFRVFRTLRNADGTGDWMPDGSYFITPTDNEIELVEDNLRFLKLHGPIREGFEWRGNSSLPDDPYASLGFNIAVVDYMKNWDYYYAGFEPSFEFDGQVYNDVWTVEEEDFVDNFPVTPGVAGVNIRAYEKYAKGIGLVYQKRFIQEYDPNTSGSTPKYNGFGVDMWMIDHN